MVERCDSIWHTSHDGVGVTRFGCYLGKYGDDVRQPCPALPADWNATKRLLVEVARSNADVREALLHVTRPIEVRCRHCGTWGQVGEDHTCPCPSHDNDCTEHPAPSPGPLNKETATP